LAQLTIEQLRTRCKELRISRDSFKDKYLQLKKGSKNSKRQGLRLSARFCKQKVGSKQKYDALEDSHRYVKKSRKEQVIRHCFTIAGGYKAAAKKMCGHVGSDTFLSIVDLDCCSKTLNNWERLLSANITVQSIDWYGQQYDHVDSQRAILLADATTGSREVPAAPSIFDTAHKIVTWEIHTIRGDASNINVNGSKAHVCEVISMFSHSTFDDRGAIDFDKLFEQTDLHRVYADLAKVPKTSSGMESRGLFLNQIAGVGMQTWIDRPDRRPILLDINGQETLVVHLLIVLMGTDNGPDQVGGDKMIELDTMGCPSQYFVVVFGGCGPIRINIHSNTKYCITDTIHKHTTM
jgi:hypothetical protein